MTTVGIVHIRNMLFLQTDNKVETVRQEEKRFLQYTLAIKPIFAKLFH